MRVAIAGLHTETNTFSPVPADLSDANSTGLLRGDAIVGEFTGSHHTIAGFLRGCEEGGAEVVPITYANAMACGPLPAQTFEQVAAEIAGGLRERGPFDVVLLAGHGAAVADGEEDPEAALAERVRAVVGPGTTVGLALDLHGNITERLIAAVDVAVGYRENPHRDPLLRGAECAALALRAARRELRPVQRLVRLPMVVPILGGWTSEGAMCDVMAEAERIAAEHGLLSFTVFHGFGYADVPQMGSSVLAVADGDAAVAERAARAIAAVLWDAREALRGSAVDPAGAFEEAARRRGDDGAVVLLDVGDNVGGGSPGDSTVLLGEALTRRTPRFAALLCDAGAVEQAAAAGLDGEAELLVGGTTPVSVGGRVAVRGRVAKIAGGRFEEPGVAHAGFRYYDGGRTVRVTTADAQEIVLTSRPLAGFTPAPLREMGVDVAAQDVVVAKGVTAPRAGYGPVARDFVLVDTPGVTTADLARFDYRRCRRPLWPLDRDTPLDLGGPAHGA